MKILSAFKKLANPAAKLLLIERILPDSEEFSLGKLVDLEMMAVTPGGRERTLGEFEKLIRRAELRIERIVGTESTFGVIEVLKV